MGALVCFQGSSLYPKTQVENSVLTMNFTRQRNVKITEIEKCLVEMKTPECVLCPQAMTFSFSYLY